MVAKCRRIAAAKEARPHLAHRPAVDAAAQAPLEAHGAPIGPLDSLIAGHAVALGATLVTGNARELGRVEGREIANWIATPS